MISTSPGSDLAGAIARSWDLLRKAPLAIDEPAAMQLGQALDGLRELYEELTAPTSEAALDAAMVRAATGIVGLRATGPEKDVREVLNRIHDEVRNAGSNLLGD
ncbi:hypothetical protein [Paraburkholderia youngii]|uniref:hypothetical protein n=1 Tax=Paraburkholderia youngii TaxID=2782701 RepID=UPI003D231E51